MLFFCKHGHCWHHWGKRPRFQLYDNSFTNAKNFITWLLDLYSIKTISASLYLQKLTNLLTRLSLESDCVFWTQNKDQVVATLLKILSLSTKASLSDMLQPSVCYLNAAETDFSLQHLAESPGCHSEPHTNVKGGSFCLHISVIAPSTWTRALVGDVAAHAVYSSRFSSACKRQNVLTFLCFNLCISCCLYTNASSSVCCCQQTLCMSRCRIGIPTVYTSCDAALVNTNTLFLNILQQEICFVLFVSFYERTLLLSFGLFSCTCQCLYMLMKK